MGLFNAVMSKIAFAIPLVLLAAACGDDEKKPPVTPAKPAATVVTTTTTTAAKPNSDKLAINADDDIVKACNLSFDNVQDAPKFDYNDDSLTQGEKTVLDAIAKCLTTGPLKGRTVELVGRADPRGETEYNMTLGAKRAKQVNSYLGQLGVGAGQMRDTSRGELDATGKDEDGWRKDRRVDVKLVK